jgi:MarR family transcriptional regulator, organic hydroperoxide resistance regulator
MAPRVYFFHGILYAIKYAHISPLPIRLCNSHNSGDFDFAQWNLRTQMAEMASPSTGEESVKRIKQHNTVALSDRLCFDVYAAARAITRGYGPLLSELGLTYPQYLVMVTLWQHSPRTVKELGLSLDLDSGTLSPLLKRLAAAGLVTRHRRPDDERTVEIAPTPKGRALSIEATRVPVAIAAMMGITERDARNLRAVLRKLTSSLDQSERRGMHRIELQPPAAAS